MAKKVTGQIKLQIPAGAANPSPPVGPALGQRGENMQGLVIPVIITVYADRSFTFVTKSPPAPVLLKRAAGIEKGSATPHKIKVGKVSKKQIEEIAQTKIKDLTASDLDAAMRSVAGTARSMGIDVID